MMGFDKDEYLVDDILSVEQRRALVKWRYDDIPTWHSFDGLEVVADGEGRVVVPMDKDGYLRRRVLIMCHEDANHCGEGSTLRLLSHFAWEGKWKDARKHVRSCVGCQIFRGSSVRHGVRKRDFMLNRQLEYLPGQRVIVDLIGPFKEKDGFVYVVTIVDDASRFKYCEPTGNATAATVCAALLRWSTLYGVPEYVQSDGGPCFKSTEFERFLKALGVRHDMAKPYHPQAQARQERQTQQLKLALRAYGLSNGGDWVEALFIYQARCNQMHNRSIGMAPIEAFLGRKVRLPSDVSVGAKLYNVELARKGWASFKAHLESIQRLAASQSMRAAQVSKEYYDGSRSAPDVQPGDLVLFLFPAKGTLDPEWKGPYKVLSQIEGKPNSFRLHHIANDAVIVAHAEATPWCGERRCSWLVFCIPELFMWLARITFG